MMQTNFESICQVLFSSSISNGNSHWEFVLF